MGSLLVKACASCSASKPSVDFYRRVGNKDGLDTLCKVCARARARELRRINHERVLAREAQMRADNRGRLRESYARWAASHPELKKERSRADYVAHRDAYKARAQEQRERDPERARERSDESRRRAQNEALSRATRARQEWTGAEMAIATERNDYGYARTAKDVALMLGRSLFSVATIRRRCRTDPKYQRVLGVQD